jgi:hypothetical protein
MEIRNGATNILKYSTAGKTACKDLSYASEGWLMLQSTLGKKLPVLAYTVGK